MWCKPPIFIFSSSFIERSCIPFQWVVSTQSVARGAIHSTKIQTSPIGKSGPPQNMDQFLRNVSGWTEPMLWVLDEISTNFG